MKFFIDTANLDQIKEAASIGILDGVTTNPTLLAREGGNPIDQLTAICEVVQGPVNGEVVGEDAESMIREGEKIAKIAPNIVVKIPMTKEGMKAVKHFAAKKIETNVTLVFSANQALLAAKAGATYISPFLGRLDDIGHIGMEIVEQAVTIYSNYGIETQVLAASIRNPLHVIDAALAGAHISTVPSKVIDQMFRHPLTDSGIESFLNDWKKLGFEL
ncbi:MAG: fructose-6-phosphate aldolase [Gemmatimonadetes bacterium]|nr:fructose-6-phosphate aldolase [Gemmatimonadota bacterium]